MTAKDREKWDRKYAATDLLHGEGPPAFLTEVAFFLPTHGPALDVACGEGQAAIYLAERGLTVTAVDISSEGLAKGRVLARSLGLKIDWIRHDLDAGLPEETVGPFDIITCLRFYAPDLVPSLASSLAEGGLLVMEVRAAEGPNPGRFRAPPGFLFHVAEGMEILLHREGKTQQLCARKGSERAHGLRIV